jgi:CheY-like chemotaxis protein
MRGAQTVKRTHKDAINATILCIDDDTVQQTIVAGILESQGFKCLSAMVRTPFSRRCLALL